MIHGDGWGLQFYHAKYRTARNRRLLGIEIVGMKHPKEVKSFNPYYEDSRGYFYGKENALLIVRPTYGRKWQITDKIRRSGRGGELHLGHRAFIGSGETGVPADRQARPDPVQNDRGRTLRPGRT